jgi:hypothetical protein
MVASSPKFSGGTLQPFSIEAFCGQPDEVTDSAGFVDDF